jgi:glyoxylase-like metal-dependent hydrolase (beta-lactamase superfamily II)
MRANGPTCRAGLLTGLCLLWAAAAHGEEDRFAGVEITAIPVSGSVHMLVGAGGNIGVSVGDDGTLIIDDQFAPLADRITAALRGLGGDRPRLVLNTHFHGDHTGGNPVFGEAATIIAHHNVRARLAANPEFAAVGLPVVTFGDRIEVHFNGETIEVIHLPAGHTDGDSVVWFRNANVLHTGDLLFHGAFPFIDLGSGGSVPGVIVNLTRLLELVPEDVRIIPGHGPLAGKQAIRDTLEMIRATRAEVMTALGAGRSVDEIVTDGLDERWASWGAGFVNEERWIRTLAAGAG